MKNFSWWNLNKVFLSWHVPDCYDKAVNGCQLEAVFLVLQFHDEQTPSKPPSEIKGTGVRGVCLNRHKKKGWKSQPKKKLVTNASLDQGQLLLWSLPGEQLQSLFIGSCIASTKVREDRWKYLDYETLSWWVVKNCLGILIKLQVGSQIAPFGWFLFPY